MGFFSSSVVLSRLALLALLEITCTATLERSAVADICATNLKVDQLE